MVLLQVWQECILIQLFFHQNQKLPLHFKGILTPLMKYSLKIIDYQKREETPYQIIMSFWKTLRIPTP